MKAHATRLVLFDIDGTLVPPPGCEPRFARYLLKRGHLGLPQALASAYFWVRYLPVCGRDLPQKNKAWLAGLPVDRVREWAGEFVREALVPIIAAPIRVRLKAHLDAGDHVVLLSGTPGFIVDVLSQELGVRSGRGAVCATRDGRFRAALPVSHPYGPDKTRAAQEIASAAGLALEQAVAYGDSINDAHLFRAVGDAVAVMPDRRLREAAGVEDWEII